jgi:hypothetical protein
VRASVRASAMHIYSRSSSLSVTAHSMDEYEGIALRLAQDAGERAALRARILQQRGVAPLFDNARYSADLVRAFALMVETRAAAGQPACAWAPDEMASREACYRRLGRHIVLRGGRAAMTRAVQ